MSEGPEDLFEPTLDALLAPVAKLMIQYGTTVGTATEKLKQALVAAADDGTGTTSDSRISLKTGLHRKDVRRLRHVESASPPKSRLNAAMLTMSRWRHEAAFCDDQGAPRSLGRADDTDGPGFDTLVRQSKVDTAPATLLAEMLENGVLRMDEAGRYHLIATSFLPDRSDIIAQLQAFRATAGLHLDIGARNLTGTPEGRRYFDRVLRYSHLTPASAAALETLTQDRISALMAEVDALAYAHQQEDAKRADEAISAFAFGAYVAPLSMTSKTSQDQGPTEE